MDSLSASRPSHVVLVSPGSPPRSLAQAEGSMYTPYGVYAIGSAAYETAYMLNNAPVNTVIRSTLCLAVTLFIPIPYIEIRYARFEPPYMHHTNGYTPARCK